MAFGAPFNSVFVGASEPPVGFNALLARANPSAKPGQDFSSGSRFLEEIMSLNTTFSPNKSYLVKQDYIFLEPLRLLLVIASLDSS